MEEFRANNTSFNMLQDDVEEHELHQIQPQSKPVAISKPPPVTVYNKRLSELRTMLDAVQGRQSEVTYRILHDSINIITQSEHDFLLVKQKIDEEDLEYNTHPLKSERNVKICLFGLPEIDTKDLKNELERFNLKPFDIKVISPKNNYGNGVKIYLLFFKRKDGIKISSLHTITGLLNIRVKWEYYIPRKHQPTQCSRCQCFGHGSAHCKKAYRCVSCGESHDSKVCTKRKPVVVPNRDPAEPPPKPRVPDGEVCCANCKGNHQ